MLVKITKQKDPVAAPYPGVALQLLVHLAHLRGRHIQNFRHLQSGLCTQYLSLTSI